MASLEINDRTFERLARKAAARHLSVTELIAPYLDLIADSAQTRSGPPELERQLVLESWMRDVEARRDRYPRDFVVDDSRDHIDGGRGE